MQKYSEIVATTKADGTVEVLPGATVTVYLTGTTTLASLYSDNGITAKANPFQSAALTGRIEFYAADGRYDIKIDKAGYTTVTVADILIEDPEDIGILEDVTLVDATISTSTVTNSTLSQCILVNTEIQDVDSLQLTDTPPAVLQPRMLSWNNAEGTADLSLLDGTVLQMGQELHYRARNNTASTIADGAVVWATGTSGATGRINVGLAVADGSQPGKTVMGLMTHATAAGSDGYVANFGKVRNINTTGSAVGETWVNGDILYLHPTIPGALTKVKPAVNGNIVVTVAIVIYAGNNGTLFVRPTADSQEADEIRYTPAGTGAVATTVQSKLREGVSVKDFGAVGDGVTDDTAAIQAAIDYVAYTPSAPKKVFLPNGKYKITDTIHVGYGVYVPPVYYTSLIIEGDTSYANQGASPLAGIFPTFNDRPAINIQGGRRVLFRNFAVTGVNYGYLSDKGSNSFDRSNIANYIGPNISSGNNTRYAPYAGITIDAYSGTQPGTPYPTVNYPAFLGTVPQYGKTYSSEITLEGVAVSGFCVGVMAQPGIVNSASQGDFVTLRDCTIHRNIVGFAMGNSDMRNPNLFNCRLWDNHTAIDGLTYGNQKGQAAILAEGCMFDGVYRVLNISVNGYGGTGQGAFNAIFNNCYGEAVYSLGIGNAYADAPTGAIVFNGGKFAFYTNSYEFSPTYLLYAPWAPVYFNGTVFHGTYGFSFIKAELNAEHLVMDAVQADGWNAGGTVWGKRGLSYTCGVFAEKFGSVSVAPYAFFDYFGTPYANSTLSSEGVEVSLERANSVPNYAWYNFPIPWFVKRLKDLKNEFPIVDIAPFSLDRATYNLSAVSKTSNVYTFTASIAFMGAGGGYDNPSFVVGIGDIVQDLDTDHIYSVSSVSFSGTGAAATMTVSMVQMNNIRYSTAWEANGTLSSTTGVLRFYNSRRVYPSVYRVAMTATSGSGNISYKICGNNNTATLMTLPARVDDYLISNTTGGTPNENVFPPFSKITAADANAGILTVNKNAIVSYYGDAILCVRGS